MTGENPASAPPHDSEAARKAFHIGMCAAAAGFTWFLPPTAARALLVAAAIIALGTELARRRSPRFAAFFHSAFGPLLRTTETNRLTGASFMAVGFVLAVFLVPTRTAAALFLFAGLCDPAASFIGRRFGRHPLPFGKSIEGSLAFLATALALVAALPGLDFAPGATAALAMTLAEASPVDDNLGVPVVGAIVLRLLGATP